MTGAGYDDATGSNHARRATPPPVRGSSATSWTCQTERARIRNRAPRPPRRRRRRRPAAPSASAGARLGGKALFVKRAVMVLTTRPSRRPTPRAPGRRMWPPPAPGERRVPRRLPGLLAGLRTTRNGETSAFIRTAASRPALIADFKRRRNLPARSAPCPSGGVTSRRQNRPPMGRSGWGRGSEVAAGRSASNRDGHRGDGAGARGRLRQSSDDRHDLVQCGGPGVR